MIFILTRPSPLRSLRLGLNSVALILAYSYQRYGCLQVAVRQVLEGYQVLSSGHLQQQVVSLGGSICARRESPWYVNTYMIFKLPLLGNMPASSKHVKCDD